MYDDGSADATYAREEVLASNAVKAVARPMILSLSPGGGMTPAAAAWAGGVSDANGGHSPPAGSTPEPAPGPQASMYRITGDFHSRLVTALTPSSIFGTPHRPPPNVSRARARSLSVSHSLSITVEHPISYADNCAQFRHDFIAFLRPLQWIDGLGEHLFTIGNLSSSATGPGRKVIGMNHTWSVTIPPRTYFFGGWEAHIIRVLLAG